ncbi:MAG TPA: hypothetical protein VFV50_10910 [Bdellovibrionales bacterium]|nr:hypothetical protein [Bdellovibrionales bacterium]
MRWVGLALLLLGLSVAGYHLSRELGPAPEEAETFHALWREDLRQLQASGKLPKGWNHLRMVEFTGLGKDSWAWIENRKPEIAIDPEGDYKLEILVDLFEDEEGKAALIEYHLVDLKSENKIWELGRTLQIRAAGKN